MRWRGKGSRHRASTAHCAQLLANYTGTRVLAGFTVVPFCCMADVWLFLETAIGVCIDCRASRAEYVELELLNKHLRTLMKNDAEHTGL